MPMLINTTDVGLSSDLRNKLTALGINPTSLDDIVLALVDMVTKPTSTAEVSADTMKANARTFGLGGGSSQAAKITDKAFSFTTTDTHFSFDVSNIKNALPHDIAFVGASVVLTGSGKDRAAARQSAGSIKLPETVDQAKVSINLLSSQGSIVLNKTFPVTKGQDGVVDLILDDQSQAPSDLFVRENLELLNQAVAQLQAKK